MSARLSSSAALASLFFATGCPNASIATCGDERDVSGAWHLRLEPNPVDAGLGTSIDHEFTVDAQLEQAGATDFLGIGHFVYGTLTASDPGAFGTVTIPRLIKNDGSKSGAILGCALRINVPITANVTDDNLDQGPLRIALVGQIDAPGHILGMPGSQLVRSDDMSLAPQTFSWTASR